MNILHQKAITEAITGRSSNIFYEDLLLHDPEIREFLTGAKVIVVGGAGSIGSAFIKALCKYPLAKLSIVDQDENSLAEIIRDLRSRNDMLIPESLEALPLDFGDWIFHRWLLDTDEVDLVGHFAALKHVRTGKDVPSLRALFRTNVQAVYRMLEILKGKSPRRFFAVSTDKAADPASFMGATKRLMEMVMAGFQDSIPLTSARFANVLFSRGSLTDSFIRRFDLNQPLVCPMGIRRYFLSPEEAGSLCLLAAVMGEAGHTLIPKLDPEKDLKGFDLTVEAFLDVLGLSPRYFDDPQEARDFAEKRDPGSQEAYPVWRFEVDTNGEKAIEIFAGEQEIPAPSRFQELNKIRFDDFDVDGLTQFISELKYRLDADSGIAEWESFVHSFIPSFQFVDRGRVLNDRM